MDRISNNFALVVGVHEYRRFSPEGSFDVDGALADARTHYRQCLAMGFSPERIRVLTTPRLSPADLGPEANAETVGEATRAGIVAGLTWLIENLSGESPAAGLFTFSGHGISDLGVALCPSDVTPSFDEVVHVAGLRLGLYERGLRKAAESLTMLLDCCHAQVGLGLEPQMQARLRAVEKKLGLSDLGQKPRVIAATSREGVSESSSFGGTKMGAFTWAITSAMGQWKAVETEGARRLGVSHEELVSRTNALLRALSFQQQAVLSGPPGVEGLALLRPGVEGIEGEVSEAPTVERGRRQLDVGYYKFDLYTVLGGLKFYVEYARVTVQNGQEVWQMATGTLPASPAGLRVKYWTTMPADEGFVPITVIPEGVAWSNTTKAVPVTTSDLSVFLSVFADRDKTKAISITKPSYGLSTVEWFSASRGNLTFTSGASVHLPIVTTNPQRSLYFAQVSVNRG